MAEDTQGLMANVEVQETEEEIKDEGTVSYTHLRAPRPY